MKGRPIDRTKLEPLFHRTHSWRAFYDYIIDQGVAATTFYADFRAKWMTDKPGVPPPPLAEIQTKYKKTIEAFVLSQGPAAAKSMMKSGAKVTPPNGGTWFSPSQVHVDAGDAGFSQLMVIGALQPEWFGDGCVKMTISKDLLTLPENQMRKPTCLDGMQSALFVPRNTDDTYGMTGGGFQEFLASAVPASAIVDMEFVVPSLQLQEEIQRIYQEYGNQGANKGRDANGRLLDNATPFDAMNRGQSPGMNAQAQNLYGAVDSRTKKEHSSPTATADAQKSTGVNIGPTGTTPTPRKA